MGLTTSWIARTKSRCKTYFDRKTISFTMMKFLAMFCLFIALFNEMEAKPIRLIPKAQLPANLQDDYDDDEDAREDKDEDEEAEEEEEDEDEGEEEERQDDYDDDEDAREDKDEDEEAEEEEEDEDEG